MTNSGIRFYKEGENHFFTLVRLMTGLLKWTIFVFATYSTLLYMVFLHNPDLIFKIEDEVVKHADKYAKYLIYSYLFVFILCSITFLIPFIYVSKKYRAEGQSYCISGSGISFLSFILSLTLIYVLMINLTFKILGNELNKVRASAYLKMYVTVCANNHFEPALAPANKEINDQTKTLTINALSYIEKASIKADETKNPMLNWGKGFYAASKENRTVFCNSIHEKILNAYEY